LTKPVIIGIDGPVLTGFEIELLRAHRPKGVILFKRNIENTAQLTELTASLKDALPLDAVIMVDQEGGRVARLRAPHWPEMPAAADLLTEEAALAHGRQLAAMVRDAGFNVIAQGKLLLAIKG
jgi:beta-N-acetylhexosaminidase